MKKKIRIIGIVLAVVLISMNGCRFVPGSEQWYIQKNARTCINTEGLQEGEKLVFINGTQHRYACEHQGQPCQDVAVKYAVKAADGSLKHRIVYLLLSENCKEVIEVHF